jgi:C-terminal processing protease CtpA/Prc
MSKPFEVKVPPGLLGMVIDTPGGGIPIVRAIKSNSVLRERVMVGDRLVAVDDVNVEHLSAVEVSSLISTKSHLHRLLVFIRPQPEKSYKLHPS